MSLRLKKPKFIEKRDSARVELECPCSVQTVRNSIWLGKRVGKSYNGVMIKPSLFGMSILVQDTIPEGSTLEIVVHFDQKGYDSMCVLEGEVLWSKPGKHPNQIRHGIRLSSKGKDSKEWQRIILEKLKITDRDIRHHSFKS
jgi:hypothetical protein